jgi:uncharacterized membrane protein YdjX (TVP38/TMEM64 family)
VVHVETAAEDISNMGNKMQLKTTNSWLATHWPKLVALALWIVLVGAYAWYAQVNQLGPLAAAGALIDILRTSTYGVIIYILIYALRPLVFFSAVLLTLLGGALYGPIWGVLIVIIGSNLSAMVAYGVGRYFGQGMLAGENSAGTVQRYAERMRNNSFETILIMRFIFLPYDLVNYLGGLLHINWRAFLFATALGSIPGTISFVLFGASIEGDFDGSLPTMNPWVLLISVALFLVSLGLSRYFKGRERARMA